MAEMKQYVGHCQCGAVRYTVDMALDKVIACNCSICKPSGTLLSFVPESAFHLETPESALTTYAFNRHHIQHLFCATCGIKSFARGKDREGKVMIAINARCLDGVDPWTLEVQHFDGASL